MEHLFNAFVSRRTSTVSRRSSCDNAPDLYTSKNKMVKRRISFGSRQTPSSPSLSNTELVNIMDEQLLQIREKLAEFREQDNYIRERMDSLSDSVSELSSRRSSLSLSSTSSECSDLDWLDEISEEEESDSENVGQEALSSEPRIPTVKSAARNHFRRQPVICFRKRRSSYPSSPLRSSIELSEAASPAVRRHSTPAYPHMYPQYNNPEDISTLF